MENDSNVVHYLTFLLFVFISLFLFIFRIILKMKLPSEWTEIGVLKNIYMYPLKSGYRTELKKAECTDYGLKSCAEDGIVLRDRSFLLYNSFTNEYLSAINYPKIVLIKCTMPKENIIEFSAPNTKPFVLNLNNISMELRTHCFLWSAKKVETIDCGDQASKWFSQYLEKNDSIRLGYLPDVEENEKKHCRWNFFKKSTAAVESYSDVSSYMTINSNSVSMLNSMLTNRVHSTQFRPNIVVNGPDKFSEYSWQWVKIGEAVFRCKKPCTRCTMISINPETAIADQKNEPLVTLKTCTENNRKSQQNSPAMGIYMELYKHGIISENDKIYIG